jgi:hypothetical protein
MPVGCRITLSLNAVTLTTIQKFGEVGILLPHPDGSLIPWKFEVMYEPHRSVLEYLIRTADVEDYTSGLDVHGVGSMVVHEPYTGSILTIELLGTTARERTVIENVIHAYLGFNDDDAILNIVEEIPDEDVFIYQKGFKRLS